MLHQARLRRRLARRRVVLGPQVAVLLQAQADKVAEQRRVRVGRGARRRAVVDGRHEIERIVLVLIRVLEQRQLGQRQPIRPHIVAKVILLVARARIQPLRLKQTTTKEEEEEDDDDDDDKRRRRR